MPGAILIFNNPVNEKLVLGTAQYVRLHRGFEAVIVDVSLNRNRLGAKQALKSSFMFRGDAF